MNKEVGAATITPYADSGGSIDLVYAELRKLWRAMLDEPVPGEMLLLLSVLERVERDQSPVSRS